MQSARAFLVGIVDYAGLFPPAGLSMIDALESYRQYLAGPDRDVLGRFVVPAARLEEFSDCAGDSLAPPVEEPWRLAVTAGADARVDELHDGVREFNRAHAAGAGKAYARCDTVELPATSRDQIAEILRTIPEDFGVFLETPPTDDGDALISFMSGTRAAAKIRTGGVVANAIPSAARLLRFMRTCSDHEVPFKATAGLHHAVTAAYPLTYESDAARADMFGFLNVFLAATFVRAGAGDAEVVEVLEERDPAAFVFDDAGASWRGHRLSTDQLVEARRTFALSYGSCSFSEPVTEAKELGLL